MERGWKWLVTAVAACLVVTGCATGTDSAQNGADADDGAAGAQAEQAEPGSAADEGSDLAGDSTEESQREIITTASAVLEVDDPEAAVTELISRTAAHGGHVEDRQQRTDEDGNHESAALTLRVPAENLTELLGELDQLGEVTEVSESAQDVTGTVRDLDARIEALETSVDRLLEIMAEADSAEDLLRAETTLSERQADLEALQAQRNDLGDQVAMSTLEVRLSSEPLTEVEPDGFLGGLQDGWNALVAVANALLVVAGALLPWLAVLAVPVVVAVFVTRRIRRRGTAAPTPSPEDEAAEPQSAEPPQTTEENR